MCTWSTRIVALLALTACGRAKSERNETATAQPADVVELDSAQLAAAHVALGVIGRPPPDTIALTGTITFDPARVSRVSPRVQGRVRRVLVDLGTRVTAGDTLALLDSPELATTQASRAKAKVNRDVAAQALQRVERLYRDGIVSARRRLEAQAEVREREADLHAAEEQLAALGAEPDTAGSSLFALLSPLEGEVVGREARVGEVVGPEANLFTVGDVSRLWLFLDVYETDLARVRAGTDALLATEAYPERRFHARVDYIGAVVDSISRTVKVRLEVPNPERLLKPGMFVRAWLPVVAESAALGLPRDAVQTLDTQRVVFVPLGGGRFRTRAVFIGRERAGGWLEVRGGLGLGDTVVVRGAFALKSRLLGAAAGEEEP